MLKKEHMPKRKITRISFKGNSFIRHNDTTICNSIYVVNFDEYMIPAIIYKNIESGKYDNSNIVVHMDVDNNCIQVDVTGVASIKKNDKYNMKEGEIISDLKAQRTAFSVIKNIFKDIEYEFASAAQWFGILKNNTSFMVDNTNKCINKYRESSNEK